MVTMISRMIKILCVKLFEATFENLRSKIKLETLLSLLSFIIRGFELSGKEHVVL